MLQRFPRSLVPLFLLVSLIPCVCGCGIRVGEVSGTVTIHGEPAPEGLRVMFQAKDSNAETIHANTGVGGHYQLIHRSGKKGIEPGNYVVSIDFWGEKSFLPPELREIEIPEKYRDGNSAMVCTVPSGGTVFDIAVE
ncbi:MAG: hypothetical protein ACPGMQ_08250 [Pirellulales bacterium]|jgi:hypothetical protein